MKLLLVTTLAILLLVFVLPGILTFGIRYIPNDSQPPLGPVEVVDWQHPISQSFVSEKSSLAGIGMSIKNPNLKNDQDIILSLYEEGNLVRMTILNGKNIEDGSFVRFMFAALPDSAGKEYTLVLTAPTVKEFPLEVFWTRQKSHWSRELLFTREEIESVDGSLSFVSFHEPESHINLLREIYDDWLSRFWADRTFFFFYSGLLVVLLLALV